MKRLGTTSDEAGFTLVEMLVSLALISLMAIYALRSLTMMKEMDRVSVEIAAQNEVDIAARFMEEELSGVRLHLVGVTAGQPKLVFDGSPHRVEFVTVGDTRREEGGLYLVSYSVNEQHQLIARRKILSGDSEHSTDVTLLSGIENLHITYTNKDGAVSDQWIDQKLLPVRIVVHVSFVGQDRRAWRDATADLALAD